MIRARVLVMRSCRNCLSIASPVPELEKLSSLDDGPEPVPAQVRPLRALGELPGDHLERGVVVDEEVPELVRDARRTLPLRSDSLSRASVDLLDLPLDRELLERRVGEVARGVEEDLGLDSRARVPVAAERRVPPV